MRPSALGPLGQVGMLTTTWVDIVARQIGDAHTPAIPCPLGPRTLHTASDAMMATVHSAQAPQGRKGQQDRQVIHTKGQKAQPKGPPLPQTWTLLHPP